MPSDKHFGKRYTEAELQARRPQLRPEHAIGAFRYHRGGRKCITWILPASLGQGWDDRRRGAVSEIDLVVVSHNAANTPASHSALVIDHPVPREVREIVERAQGLLAARAAAPTTAHDPFDRATVWIVAAPGVAVTDRRSDRCKNPPALHIIRTQDPRRVPPDGVLFDAGEFTQQMQWVLVATRYSGYRVLVNPDPDTLASPEYRAIQWITALEHHTGVNFTMRIGSTPDAPGCHLSVSVDPASGADRFWYAVEHAGNSAQLRLRVVTTPHVSVEFREAGSGSPSSGFAGDMLAAFWSALLVEKDVAKALGMGWDSATSRLDAALGADSAVGQASIVAGAFLLLQRTRDARSAEQLPPPSLDVHEWDAALPRHIAVEERGFDAPSATGIALSEFLGVDRVFAEFASSLVLGFLPYIGDAADLADFTSMAVTGETDEGTPAGLFDYLLQGIFVLVSSGAAFELGKRWLRPRFGTRDWEAVLDAFEEIDPEDVARLESLARKNTLDEADQWFLRELLAGVSARVRERGVTRWQTFDSLIGTNGFRHMFVESRYRTSARSGESRKAWLRRLARSTDEASQTMNALVRLTVGDVIYNIETIDPDVEGFAPALARYFAAFRTDISTPHGREVAMALRGPQGAGLAWDAERFPVSLVEQHFDGVWTVGMPVDTPVPWVTVGGGKNAKKMMLKAPHYDHAAVRERFWHNIYHFASARRTAQPWRRVAGAAPPQVQELMRRLRSGEKPTRKELLPFWEDSVDLFDPVGNLPDWQIDYQLARLNAYPRGLKLVQPPGVELDHKVAPQRAYDDALAALVAPDTQAVLSTSQIKAAERQAFEARVRAHRESIDIANMLIYRLRQSSGAHLQPKSSVMHAIDDAIAGREGIDSRHTALVDPTFWRQLSGVDVETIQWLGELASRPGVATDDMKALRWFINQERSGRGLDVDLFSEFETVVPAKHQVTIEGVYGARDFRVFDPAVSMPDDIPPPAGLDAWRDFLTDPAFLPD